MDLRNAVPADVHTRLWGLGNERARQAAFALLGRATTQQELDEITAAVLDIVGEITRWRDAWAAEHVDKGRQVRAAAAQSEDCEEHGAEIRHERHQAFAYSRLAEAHDSERVAWVDTCWQLCQAMKATDPERAAKYEQIVAKASQRVRKIRADLAAPTFADCQRAGRCEHPDTPPHGACEQLALFEAVG